MGNECYAMVRGSGIRLTDLDAAGRYGDPDVLFATSKSVVSVAISEVVEGGSHELLRNSDDDDPRIHLVTPDTPIRYEVDINFLRCDPSILNLMTALPIAYNAAGDVVGFDARTRLPVKAFALEVWSKLAGMQCKSGTIDLGFGEAPFGVFPFGSGLSVGFSQAYGYTLFPFLKGGTVGGFTFAKGLVSFNVKGARTQRGSKWGVGPYDLDGPALRLPGAVSRNTQWKTFVTSGAPPVEAAGVSSFVPAF